MAARVVKKKSRTAKRAVSKLEMPDLEMDTKVSSKKKSSLTFRKKLLILVAVLVAAYLLYVYKGIFVAAVVNGQLVPRLRVVQELEKQGGQQVLDSVVNEMLIMQEAKKAGISVSSTDLDAKVEEFKGQIESQGQELDSLLSAQGMSMEDFRDQIKIQVYLEKLLSDRVEVTEEQIKSFLETNKDFMPENLSEEEKRTMAQKELKQQGLSGAFSAWLSEVKNNSSINYFVEY